jgi:signal transduction histidine kinase
VDSTFDPAAIAAQVREDFERRVEKDHGVLRVDVRPARARGSTGLLRQVLGNLTENALKYRRPNVAPAIDITGAVSEGEYVLRVADNGMGMSAEEAGHAFEPLYRAPMARKIPGTGLGLSIVKRVVEASGGTISIDSRLGDGTAVEIHLPLAGSLHDARH